MSEPVKTTRSYSSKRRAASAEATRQVILDAARRLLERDGYLATSMQAIADEAQVAVKTIYLAFESKADLLRDVWLNRLAPGEAQVPVLERKWYRDVLADDDPKQKLRLMIEHSIGVKSRSAALIEVIRGAAPGDDEVRALWIEIDEKLRSVAQDFVRQLSDMGALRSGLTKSEASDVLWALSHPTLWQQLVISRGWSKVRYAAWLERALAAELLK